MRIVWIVISPSQEGGSGTDTANAAYIYMSFACYMLNGCLQQVERCKQFYSNDPTRYACLRVDMEVCDANSAQYQYSRLLHRGCEYVSVVTLPDPLLNSLTTIDRSR